MWTHKALYTHISLLSVLVGVLDNQCIRTIPEGSIDSGNDQFKARGYILVQRVQWEIYKWDGPTRVPDMYHWRKYGQDPSPSTVFTFCNRIRHQMLDGHRRYNHSDGPNHRCKVGTAARYTRLRIKQ